MKRYGFTLVELAIVLTIVGVVIGGSFKALKSSREKAYIAEAKERVQTAKDAINGFSMEWIDLPTWGEFARELSSIKGKVADQNKTFFYYNDATLSNDIDICLFNDTNLEIDIYDAAGVVDHTISNVAYVLAEQGVNRNIQTGFSSSGGIDTVNVYTASSTEDDNSGDFTRDTDEYDDIVQWVTLAELQKGVNCSDNKLSLLNEHALPRDLDSSSDYLGGSSSAIIYADNGYPLDDDADSGSEPDYEWCIENSPAWLDSMDCGGNSMSSQSDCMASGATYEQCTSPSLDGNPSSRGSAGVDSFRVYVRDKTKTINKQFTITIDSDTSSGSGVGVGTH